MTKTKLHAAILALCVLHNASDELTDALDVLTKPKVGGGSSNVEDYTCFNEEGNPEFIFCTYHKQWEPVANEDGDELFIKDEKSKNGFRRYCDMGDKQWKAQAKIFTTSKAAIMADVLDEVMTGSEGKAAIEALQAARDVHTAREDGLGEADRPCGMASDTDTEEA